jgi:hypothetical protein
MEPRDRKTVYPARLPIGFIIPSQKKNNIMQPCIPKNFRLLVASPDHCGLGRRHYSRLRCSPELPPPGPTAGRWLYYTTQVHQIRISLGAAQARRLLDTVAVYQAMGGGFPADAEALAANCDPHMQPPL